MTLVTRYLTPFTGAGVSELPQFPPFSLGGVDDYSQRWVASAAPSPAATWTSVSAEPLTLAAVNANRPIKTTDALGTYLDFSAGNAALLTESLTYRTIGLLVSLTNDNEVAPMVGTLESGSLSRQVGSVAFGATGGAVALANDMNGDLWHAVFLTVDGDTGALYIDAAKSTNTATTQALITGLRLGQNWAASVFGKMRVMEVVTYSRAVSEAEIVAIRSAWRAAYPGISLP